MPLFLIWLWGILIAFIYFDEDDPGKLILWPVYVVRWLVDELRRAVR